MKKLNYWLMGFCLVGLIGCATTQKQEQEQGSTTPYVSTGNITSSGQQNRNMPPLDLRDSKNRRKAVIMQQGNGVFIKTGGTTHNYPVTEVAANDKDTLSLNFEDADIADVARLVFDTLKLDYIIDAGVSGSVSIQMNKPVSQKELLPLLEYLLSMNGAAATREGNLYHVRPSSSATTGGRITTEETSFGTTTRLFKLKYIAAEEMVKILTPFAPQGGMMQADSARNILMLSGTPRELDILQETINTFDIDWLQGMTVGMYTLESLEAEAAVNDLNTILGDPANSPLAGMLRFVPIKQLNSIMVITPQKKYLAEVEKWLARLDKGSGERLYIYNVAHTDANYLASMLSQIFGSGGGSVSSGGGTGTAPNTSGVALGSGSNNSTSTSSSSSSTSSGSSKALTTTSLNDVAASVSGGSISLGGPGSNGKLGPFGMNEVRVVADPANNTLLIWANSTDYDKIVSALRRIDLVPRQVLIEATIAEVQLKGDLQYGINWYFKNNVDSRKGAGSLGQALFSSKEKNSDGSDKNRNALDTALAVRDKSYPNQFMYGIVSGDAVRALLTMLASDSKVKILSSPHVLVLDNQEAIMKVGGQEPVATGQMDYSSSTNSSISYTYRDTGVQLHVKPKVNASGQVTMSIKQEILSIAGGSSEDKAGKNPSFNERTIETQVTVKDGETILLGGLIAEQTDYGKSGIPVLYKLPWVGHLFGSTSKKTERSELMIMVRPRVIQSTVDAANATLEMQARMKELTPFINEALYKKEASSETKKPAKKKAAKKS